MKHISVNITIKDELPHIDIEGVKYAGSMFDNQSQELKFTRPVGYEDHDLLLVFWTGSKQYEENIGKENTYVVTNRLTRNNTLVLQVAFAKDTFRFASNQVELLYRAGAEGGVFPQEMRYDYIGAVTTETLSEDSQASVAVKYNNGKADFAFGVPRGKTGDTGLVGPQGEPGKSYTKEEIMEMSCEYGLFVDTRSTATTGYWHKLFTCKTSGYNDTDVNLKLSVLALYGSTAISNVCGILDVRIRQGANGAALSNCAVIWESCAVAIDAEKLKRFAVNVVPDSTGNYLEFYIYNTVRYAGYKVSVIDKGSRSSGYPLTFTGEVNWNPITELTELPTNGTIIYSTLGDYMTSRSAIEAATADSGWIDLTLLNGFAPYQSLESNNLKVRKIGGSVSLVGMVSPPDVNTLGTNTETVIAKLPSGYYPRMSIYSVMCGIGNATWVLKISDTGEIRATCYQIGGNLATPTNSARMTFNATYITK